MKRNDGGAAFPPMSPLDSWGDPDKGLSARDYFAGQALPGIMMAQVRLAEWTGRVSINDAGKDAAKMAYEVADAMIAERDK